MHSYSWEQRARKQGQEDRRGEGRKRDKWSACLGFISGMRDEGVEGRGDKESWGGDEGRHR